LLKNDETVRLERAALEKLQAALTSIQDRFRADFESQLAIIKVKEAAEERLLTEAKKREEEALKATGEADVEEMKTEPSKDESEPGKGKTVDTAKISALNKMLDDFENILSKNFCQFANYEDFSFAKSRTTE